MTRGIAPDTALPPAPAWEQSETSFAPDHLPIVDSLPLRLWTCFGERILAGLLLVPALPVIVMLVLLIRLTSPGPGLYRQVRVGLRGRQFTLFKIRSMAADAERQTGPVWSTANDSRVLWCGRFLRASHLDELPQLINVVLGQMNLVGPRPERPEFVALLARQIPGYRDRLAVKPGVTGLAQMTFGPDTDLNDVRRKLILDMFYIRSMRVGLDLRIIFCTALRFFGVPSTAARRLTRIEKITDLDYEQLLSPMQD